jgi:hypothetical protein
LAESLWHSAVGLARQHGLYLMARPLLLDYAQLKRRMGEFATVSKQATAPPFVESIASPAVTMAKCMMEFESSMGGKMRIHWKGSAAPDWPSPLRAWREAER